MADLDFALRSQSSSGKSRRLSVDPTSTRKPTLRNRASTASIFSAASEGDSPILAPIPRRHLLHTAETRHLLNTPPLSSRGPSPVSLTTFDRPSSRASGHASGVQSIRKLSRPMSFSTLMENGKDRTRPASSLGRHMRLPVVEESTPNAGGKRWVRWMHKSGFKQLVVPTAILVAGLFKWTIGLGSYSGQSTPPMFGDYEAQRHWLELTLHKPIQEWYSYDHLYWGLDYPPLTAYVSWICGFIGHQINPEWFALDASRGYESLSSKTYMRGTVVAWDLLVYVPALVYFTHTWQATRSRRTQHLALLSILLQPGLLLIDFGHFQYNNLMLGLALLALNFFAAGHDLLGAVCFVLSLGFKQMALYYAPAIGSYLLGKCLWLGPQEGFQLFVRLAVVTSLSFFVLFSPWLPPLSLYLGHATSDTSHILSPLLNGPITRIFPIGRGLFEDKVANFWCASDVVFKWRSWLDRDSLVRLATAATALGFSPAVFGLLRAGWVWRRTPGASVAEQCALLPLLPYALLTSAMSFFLFSFQVHEKTILVPLLPLTLLMSGASVDSSVYAWGALGNNIGVFSMWPLLRREGLGIQYIATLVLWNRVIGYNPFRLRDRTFVQILSIAAYSAAIVLHVLEPVVPVPAQYPDLFAVLNVLVSTPVFGLIWLWSIKSGLEVWWAMGGLGRSSHGGKGKEKSPGRTSFVVGEAVTS